MFEEFHRVLLTNMLDTAPLLAVALFSDPAAGRKYYREVMLPRFTEAVGTDGPTRQQVAVLVTVCQHPSASQAELVEETGIDKNTLAQIINRLIERGLLERERTEHDARAYAITATPAAVKLLDKVLPAVREVQDKIIAPVPKELRPMFYRCLRLISGLGD